jgi:PhnB protein
MTATNVYLNFNGHCEEAFKFYEKTLGGKILAMMTAKGTPMEKNVPPELLNRIMHARMMVGTTIIMGSDVPAAQFRQPQGFAVNVNVETPAEADRIYAALAQGGMEIMAIAETFWAHRFGMCVDKWGTPWMVNCEKPMNAS